ncbi:uncharacterized protein LOC115925139 [Strongylocentrotus purpuratus]|uniref:Uncharacterized protein n=1 Tax=Strongylocentrotus purpuratus TaxID=7668 RepID=A0A7M7P5V7_STRPU|nr:uncharacterized protein LOC115925139 [Strongylocentrotus purpuratus]
MAQEEKNRDLDLPVEKLDRAREDCEGKEDSSDESYYESVPEIAEGEDIGLPIYDCPPSQDTNHMFQWHYPREFIPDGCVDYDDHNAGSGKWMLFYPVSEIDEKWEMANDLFDTGELRGVRGMKVSTAKVNPRSSDNTKAVLIMYCGPWTDELLMRKIGRNLALKTKYESKTGCMLYKTDDQTRGGTRATGQAVNHVYQMQLPRPIEGTASSAMPELLPSKDSSDFWQWHFPACSPSGCAEEYDYSKSGRWMMFYSLAEIDEKWQMMKGLFDSNELDGVRGLKVSTASSLPVSRRGNRSSVIMVYCGPWDDEDLVLRVGANLVQKTSYTNESGTLRYKTDIVGNGMTSSGQFIPRYKQVLPVSRPSMGANYSQSGVAELPPSKDMRSYWQWHPKSQDGRFTNYDSSLRGKWMLFYPPSDIDGMWQLMKDLFDAGELQGVSDAMVSTAKSIAGHPDKNSGVIMVYCGPCDDAELMLKIGENIALKTKYKDKSGIMRYRVDAPREGRRATGKSSSSYLVQVPKPQAMLASAWDTAECPPSRDTAERSPSRDTSECTPSRENSKFWQWHRKPLDGIEYDPSTSGKWMLLYPASEIDDRWHLVKSLFDAGELHGVRELQVYTAKDNAGHHDSGVINVYCGPYDDEELMMRIGKNLAKKMQYKNRNDFMLYKTEGQQGRAMGQGRNHLYEISLPWRY